MFQEITITCPIISYYFTLKRSYTQITANNNCRNDNIFSKHSIKLV